MAVSPKVFRVALLAPLLAAAWFFYRTPDERALPDNSTAEEMPTDFRPEGPRAEEQMRQALLGSPQPVEVPPEDEGSPEEKPPVPPLVGLSKGPLPWEKTLALVTGNAALDDTRKVAQLLALLPALPEEAQEACAEEIVRRTPGAAHQPVREALANPRTHMSAQMVFLADVMERPDAVRLPALLAVATRADHPLAEAARNNLSLLLRADHGANAAAWQAAVAARLAAEKK